MTDTKIDTIQDAARAMYGAMRTRERANGDVFLALKADAPHWMAEVAHRAHGDFAPDDYRYGALVDMLEAFMGADDLDEAIIETADYGVSVYHMDRFAWLSSHLSRSGYVDQAAEELGVPTPFRVSDMIAWGMVEERREVGSLLREALEDVVSE